MTIPAIRSELPATAIPISPAAPQENSSQDFTIDKKMMANIFADGYLNNSKLGATDPLIATKHLVMLLKRAQHCRYIKKPLDKTIENYETLLRFYQRINPHITTQKGPIPYQHIQNIAREMGEKVLALKSGEFLTLPGGYNSEDGGHSMLLDVEKCSNGHFNLTLFTTGDGLEYHEQIQTQDKRIVSISRKFKNIPEGVLFFSSPRSHLFFEGLIYLRIVKQDRNFSAAFIYESLMERFLSYLDLENADLEDFTKPQGNGTCSWKVLIKHLRQHLPRPDYRLLKFMIEQDIVSTFSERGNASTDYVSQNLLGIATQKLHREISRGLKEPALFTVEEAKNHQQKATLIQRTNNGYNRPQFVSKTIETMPPVGSREKLLNNCKITLQAIRKNLLDPIPEQKQTVPSQKAATLCTAENFEIHLRRILGINEQQKTSFYLWDDFLSKVPVNSALFWNSLRVSNGINFLNDCFLFLSHYTKHSVERNGYVLIPHLNSILTLYIIIDKLARKIEAEKRRYKESLRILLFSIRSLSWIKSLFSTLRIRKI